MKFEYKSKALEEFAKNIIYENRNPKDTKVLRILNEIETNSERRIEKGTELYRCRIVKDENKINKKPNFYGYNEDDSFVPPIRLTSDMRANYRYIPYLYCANDPYIALVEVRPRLAAKVSIATIKVNTDLKLLDFTMNQVKDDMSDEKKDLFSDLSRLYSLPVADDDVSQYIPTQFVAEYAKNLGYDGITFRSSLTPELEKLDDKYNLVIFNYKKCEVIKSNLIQINMNSLSSMQIDADTIELNITSPTGKVYNEILEDLRKI